MDMVLAGEIGGLTSQILGLSRELEGFRAKRSLVAREWTLKIRATSSVAKRCDREAQEASTAARAAKRARDEGARALTAARDLIRDLNSCVGLRGVEPGDFAVSSVRAVPTELVDPARRAQYQAALDREQICEECMVTAEASLADARREEAVKTREGKKAVAETRALFLEAKADATACQVAVEGVESQLSELEMQRNHLRESHEPLVRLRESLEGWLEGLAASLQVARAEKDWADAVPVSCGINEVDDGLRRLVLLCAENREREQAGAIQVARLEQDLAELEDGDRQRGESTKQLKEQLKEQLAVAMEDQTALERTRTDGETRLRRLKIDHAVAARHPFMGEDHRPKGGRTKESDMVYSRAQKPVKQLEAAFLVNTAMDMHAQELDAKRKEKERLEALEEQKKALGNKDFDDDVAQLELTAHEKVEYLEYKIGLARRAKPDKSGDKARADVRGLTRMPAMLRQARRNAVAIKVALVGRIDRETTLLTFVELKAELEGRGVEIDDRMGHAEMCAELARIRFDEEYEPLNEAAFKFPKVKVVKAAAGEAERTAGDFLEDDCTGGGGGGGSDTSVLPPL